MTYDKFLLKEKRTETLPKELQLKFYEEILDKEGKTDIRIHASFNYAKLFYYDGNFRKVIDLLEPIVVDYLSYPYTKKLLPCFNLLGAALHCETALIQARFVYEMALKIAEEKQDVFFYSYEYNNIASVAGDEGEHEKALEYLKKAEQYLPYAHESMPAFVYMNQCLSYQKLNRLDEALDAWKIGVWQYDARKYIKYDTMRTALTLYHRLKMTEAYETCKNELLSQIYCMNPAEFMDVCKDLYECEVEGKDKELICNIFSAMDQYLGKYPREIRVGLTVANLKYDFAKRTGDKELLLDALEMKNSYKDRILLASAENETKSMEHFIKINSQIYEAVKSREKAANAKSQFFANMSHDIRTPLNGMIGLLKINETHFDDLELVKRNHEKMQVVADHLKSLINDILDLSKIEDGNITLSNEPVDFPKLSQEIMIIISNIANENKIHLDFDMNQDQIYPCVYGSPIHLKQIFLNIYSNCIKYNRQNGDISTTVEVLECSETDCRYRWVISDTGIGMSEDFLTHIYEPFQQEKNHSRNTYHGTGLGMAIVKGLIEQMNGTISIESKEGIGSRFTIKIPFKTAQVASAKTEHTSSGENCIGGIRVLLAEDNDLNAEIATALLEDEKVIVTVAQNGKQAIELFKHAAPGTYDAILMDVMMPVMDGLTATKEIRKLQRSDAQTIPIIAVSANVYQEDINTCLGAGMNAHLAKPLEIEKVRKTIYEQVVRNRSDKKYC